MLILIDSHLEDRSTIEEINKIRLYFTNMIIGYKMKAQEVLKEIPNNGKHLMISVTFLSSKQRKTHEKKYF